MGLKVGTRCWAICIAAVAAVASVMVLPAAAHAQQTNVMFPASQFGNAYLVLPQSTMHLEQVLGRNANFERLINYNKDDQLRIMANPVGRLDLLVEYRGETGIRTCTASILSKKYILTNNHCAPNKTSKTKFIKTLLLMNFYGENLEHLTTSYKVKMPPVEQNATLDYAIFEVEGDPSQKFGQVALDPRDPQPGESLVIIHHPAGLPKHATRGGCRANTPRSVRGTDILHRCDTLPGSSGSPIFASNSNAMIGIHYAGSASARPGSYNFGKRLMAIAEKSTIIAGLVFAVKDKKRQQKVAAREMQDRERRAIERRIRADLEDRLKRDRSDSEDEIRTRLEEKMQTELEERLARETLKARERIRVQTEDRMRTDMEARLVREKAASEAKIRSRLEQEIKARLAQRLASNTAAARKDIRAEIEHKLKADMEVRLAREKAASEARIRARMGKKLTADMEKKLRDQSAANEEEIRSRLRRQLTAKLEKELKAASALREKDMRSDMERDLRAKMERELKARLKSGQQKLASLSPVVSAPRSVIDPKTLEGGPYASAYQIGGLAVPLPSGKWFRAFTHIGTTRAGSDIERHVLVSLKKDRIAKIVGLMVVNGHRGRLMGGKRTIPCTALDPYKGQFYGHANKGGGASECWKFKRFNFKSRSSNFTKAGLNRLRNAKDKLGYFLGLHQAHKSYFGFDFWTGIRDKALRVQYLFKADKTPFLKKVCCKNRKGMKAPVRDIAVSIQNVLLPVLRGQDADAAIVSRALANIK
jgi:V8-like Glu-specific endopeptidase